MADAANSPGAAIAETIGRIAAYCLPPTHSQPMDLVSDARPSRLEQPEQPDQSDAIRLESAPG